MSKDLVYKAISLLHDDINPDKTEKKNKDSSLKRKAKKTVEGVQKNYASLDRTEENLKILMQLKSLKPKASVAQKVLELYAKPTNSVEETTGKAEKQKSILFDDDDFDNTKDVKKRKRRKHDVDSW